MCSGMKYFKPGKLFELSLGWRSAEKITVLHEIFSIILQLIVVEESVCYNHKPRAKVFLKIKLFPRSIISSHTLAAAKGSLCSYSRYLSRLKNVLKKMYASLQFFRSLNFIQPKRKKVKTKLQRVIIERERAKDVINNNNNISIYKLPISSASLSL